MSCIIGHLSNNDAEIYIQKINSYKENKLKNMSKKELLRELSEIELNKYGTETKLSDEFYIKERECEKLLIKLIEKKNKPFISTINFKNCRYNRNFMNPH